MQRLGACWDGLAGQTKGKAAVWVPDDAGCNHTEEAMCLELARLSRTPFKSDASSNLEALNVHFKNLLYFQILRNYNHGSNDDAS